MSNSDIFDLAKCIGRLKIVVRVRLPFQGDTLCWYFVLAMHFVQPFAETTLAISHPHLIRHRYHPSLASDFDHSSSSKLRQISLLILALVLDTFVSKTIFAISSLASIKVRPSVDDNTLTCNKTSFLGS